MSYESKAVKELQHWANEFAIEEDQEPLTVDGIATPELDERIQAIGNVQNLMAKVIGLAHADPVGLPGKSGHVGPTGIHERKKTMREKYAEQTGLQGDKDVHEGILGKVLFGSFQDKINEFVSIVRKELEHNSMAYVNANIDTRTFSFIDLCLEQAGLDPRVDSSLDAFLHYSNPGNGDVGDLAVCEHFVGVVSKIENGRHFVIGINHNGHVCEEALDTYSRLICFRCVV